jgi:AraC family transcriptional regulator, arabinose operon regulatory protein
MHPHDENIIAVLPERRITKVCPVSTLVSGIRPLSVGCFPSARNHFTERPEGISETVLIYCTDGVGGLRSMGREWRIEAGDALLCCDGVPHTYWADADQPWSILYTHFSGSDVEDALDGLGVSAREPVLHVGVREDVVSLFHEMLSTCDRGGDIQVQRLLSACLRLILARMAFARSHGETVREGGIERVLHFMADHASERHSLAHLASLANLSVSHFVRRFRRRTGFAPLDYFTRLKMQRACEALDSTDRRVGEIAQALGYEDPYHFSRVFKNTIGRSPSAYRGVKKG